MVSRGMAAQSLGGATPVSKLAPVAVAKRTAHPSSQSDSIRPLPQKQ